MLWLASKSSLGLWVPSFVEPAENNLLLNPAHPDYARVRLVVEKNPFVFDPEAVLMTVCTPYSRSVMNTLYGSLA